MDTAEQQPVRDAWGEPLLESSAGGFVGKRFFSLAAAATGLVILGGVYLGVRHSIVQRLSASCLAARHAQDWDRLEVLAGQWRWWDRGNAAPLIYLAETAHQRKQYQRAVELLHELPDEDPRTPPALLESSSLLFGPLNRPIEGTEVLERAVRLDPKLVEARRRLIYFYAFTLQRHKMVKHVYDAIRNDCDLPETYVYLISQDWLSFANAYEQNTVWSQGDPDEELFIVARAIHRIRAKRLDETQDPQDEPRTEDGTAYHRKVVAEFFQRFPQNLELMAYYLDSYCNTGEVEAVADLLASAPAEAANDNRFWRYRAWLHTARRELVDAQQCYETALTLNPYDFISRHQLAGVERRLKHLDRVKQLEELSQEGKSLRNEILQLERVDKVPPGTLKRMGQYAEKCGDYTAAGKLLLRVQQWSEEWSKISEEGKAGKPPRQAE